MLVLDNRHCLGEKQLAATTSMRVLRTRGRRLSKQKLLSSDHGVSCLDLWERPAFLKPRLPSPARRFSDGGLQPSARQLLFRSAQPSAPLSPQSNQLLSPYRGDLGLQPAAAGVRIIRRKLCERQTTKRGVNHSTKNVGDPSNTSVS